MIDFGEILIAMTALMIPLIAVAGLTFRFMAKPVIESLRAARGEQPSAALEGEVMRLRAEVDSLGDQLRSLRDGREFDRVLTGASGANGADERSRR